MDDAGRKCPFCGYMRGRADVHICRDGRPYNKDWEELAEARAAFNRERWEFHNRVVRLKRVMIVCLVIALLLVWGASYV